MFSAMYMDWDPLIWAQQCDIYITPTYTSSMQELMTLGMQHK